MNILKPEVTVRKPNRHRINFIVAFVAAFAMSFVMNVGIRIGYDMGRRDATTVRPVEDDACGISAPLDCVTKITDSVTDMFNPMPVVRILYTTTRGVICADAERAYWACANDADCPNETFEAIADDVNFCQTGH